MRYQVPQFIEVEDKIFGPFTFKQFVYLGGGIGLSFILWRFFPFFIAILLIIPVLAFSAALAFYKINNKPFIEVVEAALRYVLAGKLYIWRKKPKETIKKEALTEKQGSLVKLPKLSESKLEELSWSLDVNDKMNDNDYK